MNSEGYFTVTSDVQHRSDFVSNFTTPVNLGDNYEIGLKSLCHGPVYNVTEGHNMVIFARDASIDIHEIIDKVYLDAGFYSHTGALFKEIYSKLVAHEIAHVLFGRKLPEYIVENDGKMSIKVPPNISFIVDDEGYPGKNPLSYLLHYPNGRYKKISEFNEFIPVKNHLTFVYSSIIAQSYINDRKSRLLAIVPLTSSPGYNYFEFTNVTYHPLAVSTFTDIFFSLKDPYGEQIELGVEKTSSNIIEYPTILNLHVRKTLKTSDNT